MAQTLSSMSWPWVGAPQMPVEDVYSSLGGEALLCGAEVPWRRGHKGGKDAKTHNRDKQEREKQQMGSKPPTLRAGREHMELSQNLRFSAGDKTAEPSDDHSHTEQGQIPADSSSPHVLLSLIFYFEPLWMGK